MKKIHCIGIGGIGVSALAGILSGMGNPVSGSDSQASNITEKLEKQGLKIFIGHKASNIPKNTERVIHSLAIPEKNPELVEAKHRKIPIFSYPEAVGELTREYHTIAICGTHGKSTTTSLIAKALIENLFDPTVIVGTELRELGRRNYRIGKSKLLVLEACEYRRAFLNYSPKIIVLHTLDPDHLDYYKTFENYLRAFQEFASKLPRDGYFFANLDDEDVHRILQHIQNKKFPSHNIFTYSTKYPSCDFFLSGNKIIQRNANGAPFGRANSLASLRLGLVGELHLKIPGAHNRTNALAAFAVTSSLGIAPKSILQSLNHYAGASRRFEIKGKIGKTIIIDDYAHHPAEIEATLQAAREQFPKGKICVVFQPHQYSRTKYFLKEFGASFQKADSVIIPNIYGVRDTKHDEASVTPERLVEEIKKNKTNARFGNGLESTEKILKQESRKYAAIFTMGAGDVWKIADAIVTAK